MSRKKIRDHYAPRIRPNAPGWEILDWASEAAQHKRFETLVRLLKRMTGFQPVLSPRCVSDRLKTCHPLTLLDVGCGTADLFPFLQKEMPLLRYTGVDLLPEIINEAKRRHPYATLSQANIFEETIFPPRSFDVVFCSGVFNLELGNNDDFLARALPVLWELANCVVVVNLLHERAFTKFGSCHYYKPSDVLALCHKLTPRVTFDDTYLGNDFTVALWRDDN